MRSSAKHSAISYRVHPYPTSDQSFCRNSALAPLARPPPPSPLGRPISPSARRQLHLPKYPAHRAARTRAPSAAVRRSTRHEHIYEARVPHRIAPFHGGQTVPKPPGWAHGTGRAARTRGGLVWGAYRRPRPQLRVLLRLVRHTKQLLVAAGLHQTPCARACGHHYVCTSR